MIQNKQIK